MNKRASFYSKVLSEMIEDRKASILVCGGGITDKEILEELGFKNVTISNLDERLDRSKWAPYEWKFENMESLSFDDRSYDYVISHATIHHASSPHKALTEMYRVAQNGLLAFEARDSMTMRFLNLLRLVDTYEQAAVYYNDCKYGGVNNTDIPNYIFRWTEREVEKTIKSYAPFAEHKFHYRYGTAISGPHELEKKGGGKSLLFTVMRPLFPLVAKVFPRQQNLFAFYIEKPTLPDMLFPWLRWNNGDIAFNKEWGDHKYKRLNGS